MSSLTVLDRVMYTVPQAAGLLRVAPSTLHYWLEGGTRRGKTYRPVIRPEAMGSDRMSWAEFIEAGLLRQYRRIHQVPMPELRTVIEYLRGELGVPYPLAHQQLYVSGQRLFVEAQDKAQIDADFALVAPVSGQYMLLPPAQAFYDRVTWGDDLAQQWRPDERSDSPVTIHPDIRFGLPSVGGIGTATLFEQAESGEAEEDLADTFGLTASQVRWGLSYEMANHAA